MIKTCLNNLKINIFFQSKKIITLKNSGIIKEVKLKLIFTFFMFNISPIIFYFGLKIQQNRETKIIKVSQSAYINIIFNKFYFNKDNIINIIIKETIFLNTITKEEEYFFEKKRYQDMICSFMFSIVEIKLNITFATFIIYCFAKNLGYKFIKVIKIIFEYFKYQNK